MAPSVIFVVVVFALSELATSDATSTPTPTTPTTTTDLPGTPIMSSEATTMLTEETTITEPPTTAKSSLTTTSTTTTISTTKLSIPTTLTQLSSAPTPVISSESSVTVTSESPPITAVITSTLPTSVTHRYPVFISQNGHNCSRFAYVFDSNTNMCIHKCETVHCQNKGVCVLTVETNDVVTVGCRCDTNGDSVYSGDRCEKTEMSRQKERGITLGILIPITVISLLFLACMYSKMKRYGSTETRFRNNYNVNAGNL